MSDSGPNARQYWPALDGVRAVAIVAVVAYHLGHLGGGWLGVDLFFVLSGYLITTLLLSELATRGRVGLRRFWARRARRLLPAVLLLLLVLGVYAWVGGPGLTPAQLRSPALATLFYVANWQQISFSHTYFASFSSPTPLLHTWSLAIEEQYYLCWPLLFAAVAAGTSRWRARHPRASRAALASGAPRALVAVSAGLLVASAVGMGLTAHLVSVNRAYLGTDTRAWELLLGGLAACWAPPIPSARHQRWWGTATVMAAVGVAIAIALSGAAGTSTQPPMWVWDGGLVAAATCAAVLITGSVRAPQGPIARVLSINPVRWLGRVSYSLYLWHWPVIDLVTPATTGLTGAQLLAARLGLMAGATCVSYYLVERPLRRADWSRWRRRAFVPLAIVATGAVLVAATVTPPAAPTGQLAGSANGRVTEASAPGPTTPSPIGRTGLTPIAKDPLRVWILGDSVMFDSSPGVTAALQATGRATVVTNSSFGGWGLTTATSWPSDSQQIIEQYHPQMVLGTWSWDDTEAEQHPKAYQALLHRALATWLAPGTGIKLVVLLEFPERGPSPPSEIEPLAATLKGWAVETRQQDAWNAIARRVVLEFPGHAVYLSTNQLFAPGGRFFTWFRTPQGTWVRARKLDATHMCPYGAAELGLLVVNDLNGTVHLGQPAPGWQYGTWTTNPTFNDPPGACPDDQPPPHYRGQVVPAARTHRHG